MTRFHWMGRGAGALALMLPLAACETPPLSANVVNASEAQVAQRATFGTVVGFRQVLVQGGNQGAELAGTAGGAAIGIAAGNQIGDGRGRDAAQAIGGIIGAVAGNRAARGATSQAVLRVDGAARHGRYDLRDPVPADLRPWAAGPGDPGARAA